MIIFAIIPLREMLGNYNTYSYHIRKRLIIPLREMLGNYNLTYRYVTMNNYTLERDVRELQRVAG